MPPPRSRRTDDHTVDALHDKLDRVLVILEGHHDDNGTHFPGLSHRTKALELEVEILKEFMAAARRMIITVVLGAISTVVAAWAIIGFGPKH